MGTELEARKLKGILWPIDEYEGSRGVNRPVHKKEIEQFDIGGEVHKGVLRDKKSGIPSGAQEIFGNAHLLEQRTILS